MEEQIIPSILYFSYVNFEDRFFIKDFKYKDDLGNQYYEILDVQTMKKCLGRFVLLEFENDEVFDQCTSRLMLDHKKASDLNHNLLSKQLGSFKYVSEQTNGFISIFQS